MILKLFRRFQDDLRNLEKARRVSDDQLSKQLRGMKKSLGNLKKELEYHKNPERLVYCIPIPNLL